MPNGNSTKALLLLILHSLMVLILSNMTPVEAQSSRQIRYGTWQSSDLTSDYDSWTFVGQRGDQIIIDMMAASGEQLDPHLMLFSPSQRQISIDDDSGGGFDARIWGITLPESGEYEIIASSRTGLGRYHLQLVTWAQLKTLALTKPQHVTLSNESAIQHMRIDPLGLEFVRIVAEAQNTRATVLMTVYDQWGEVVTTSHYQSASTIDPIVLQSDQAYILTLKSVFLEDDRAREYEILLESSSIELLAPHKSYASELMAGAVNFHYFEGNAGQDVQLQVVREVGDVSMSVYIRSLTGEAFVASTTGTTLNTVTLTFTLPQSGIYLIEVSDGAYSASSGTYQIEYNTP